MAEFLATARERERDGAHGHDPWVSAYRSDLRALRRAPRACVRRRSEADGIEVLHEFGIARFQAAGNDLAAVPELDTGEHREAKGDDDAQDDARESRVLQRVDDREQQKAHADAQVPPAPVFRLKAAHKYIFGS